MRTIIFGDIHGCNRMFQALIDRVSLREGDTVVLLGDLFDRGSESWEVFQTVRALSARFGERFILLLGNHEDYLLQPRLSFQQRMIWDRVGRGATARSFKAHGGQMEDAIPWLEERCRLFWRGDGFQCVHAGLLVDPPEANDKQTLVHDHSVVFRNKYDGPLTIVGHIALDMPVWFAGDGKTKKMLDYGVEKPLPDKGVICIDTGCGKGGGLTAMIVEDGRYQLHAVFNMG